MTRRLRKRLIVGIPLIVLLGAGGWAGLHVYRVGRLDLEPLPRMGSLRLEPAVQEAFRKAHRRAEGPVTTARANGQLGMRYHAHRMFRNAAICYRRALSIDPDNFRYRYLLGLALSEDGQEESALAELKRADTLKPDYVPNLVKIGELCVRARRLDDAEEVIRRALAISPDCSHAHAIWGRIAASRGDYELAIRRFENALSLAPDDHQTAYSLARACQKVGRLYEAEARLERLPERVKPLPIEDAYVAEMRSMNISRRRGALYAGVGLLEQGKFDDAIAHLRVAVEEEPTNPEAHAFLGGALAAAKRYEESLKAYAEALRLSPDHVRSLVGRGRALAALGRLDEAELPLRRALVVDPVWREPYNLLGLLLMSREQYAEAADMFESAVRLEPGDADGRINLANVLYNLGRLGRARECVRKGLAIDPNNARGLLVLGRILAAQGDWQAAARSYDRSIQINPRLVGAYYELAVAQEQLGRVEDAVQSLQRLLVVVPSHRAAQERLATLRNKHP